jgi:DNA-binding response OmpR family regulator
MSATGRFTALVIHGDGGVLDVLTRWFEASGFEVVTAPSTYRAQAALEAERPIEVVVVPWDHAHPIGGEVYRWMLANRPDLRSRFVFIADDVAPDFDTLVGGRCLALPIADPREIVRVASGVVRRVRTPPRGVPVLRGPGRPPLLLVDDDPLILQVSAELLTQTGYAVTQVDNLKDAIDLAELRDFNVLLCDWRMHDGSGADLFRWAQSSKPHLADRIVFLSEGEQDEIDAAVLGRPVLRKGMDSQQLLDTLRGVVERVRGM